LKKAFRALVDITRSTYLDASEQFLETYNIGRNNTTIPAEEKEAYTFARDLVQKDSRLTELDAKEATNRELSEAEQEEKNDLEEFFTKLNDGSETSPELIQSIFDTMRYEYARVVLKSLLATPKEDQTKTKLNDLQFFEAFIQAYESTEGRSNMPKEELREEANEKDEAVVAVVGGKRKAHKTRKAHKKHESKHTTRKQ
jgi:hypothetical protein